MTVKNAVVKRIKNICLQRNYTINELANMCGLTSSTIYSLMSNERKNVNITTIKIICDGLEITLSDFFDSNEFKQLKQELK